MARFWFFSKCPKEIWASMKCACLYTFDVVNEIIIISFWNIVIIWCNSWKLKVKLKPFNNLIRLSVSWSIKEPSLYILPHFILCLLSLKPLMPSVKNLLPIMNLLLVDFLRAEYRTLVETKWLLHKNLWRVNFNFANEMKKNYKNS